MKLEKIETATAKNGAEYRKLTIDGKTYNFFGEDDLLVGDNVECEFEQKVSNGKSYTNLIAIKVHNSPVQAIQGANSIVIERKEKPHSYEFGIPSARHKIYYDNVADLKAHIQALKDAGFILDGSSPILGNDGTKPL